ECIQILRIFTNQFPEAKITSFLVLEEAPPQLLIAIGLDTGNIYCIEGDMAREKITRFKLQVDNASYKDNSAVRGMGFRVEGQATLLFAVTPSSVSLFTFQSKPSKGQTLDQIGCHVNCVATSDRSVYYFPVILQFTAVVNEVACLLCEWGTVILIMADKSALCVGEKDMESKLDMLFKKNLYTVAINLVQCQQADTGATAEVLRKYGDHLYSKQDYDAAMAQYILTIGHLEP
ncbi:Vacuolar protein-sorting-associated protein 11-like protein, partial [Drosera capensis]